MRLLLAVLPLLLPAVSSAYYFDFSAFLESPMGEITDLKGKFELAESAEGEARSPYENQYGGVVNSLSFSFQNHSVFGNGSFTSLQQTGRMIIGNDKPSAGDYIYITEIVGNYVGASYIGTAKLNIIGTNKDRTDIWDSVAYSNAIKIDSMQVNEMYLYLGDDGQKIVSHYASIDPMVMAEQNPDVAPTPEPASMFLTALGLGALGFWKRRKA